jgi:hypothetical protein
MSTETSKAPKYIDRLKNIDSVEAEKLSFHNRKAQKSLESKIIDFEEELTDLDIALNKAYSTFPFNVDKAIDAEDKKALVTRKLDQAKRMLAELF